MTLHEAKCQYRLALKARQNAEAAVDRATAKLRVAHEAELAAWKACLEAARTEDVPSVLRLQ